MDQQYDKEQQGQAADLNSESISHTTLAASRIGEQLAGVALELKTALIPVIAYFEREDLSPELSLHDEGVRVLFEKEVKPGRPFRGMDFRLDGSTGGVHKDFLAKASLGYEDFGRAPFHSCTCSSPGLLLAEVARSIETSRCGADYIGTMEEAVLDAVRASWEGKDGRNYYFSRLEELADHCGLDAEAKESLLEDIRAAVGKSLAYRHK